MKFDHRGERLSGADRLFMIRINIQRGFAVLGVGFGFVEQDLFVLGGQLRFEFAGKIRRRTGGGADAPDVSLTQLDVGFPDPGSHQRIKVLVADLQSGKVFDDGLCAETATCDRGFAVFEDAERTERLDELLRRGVGHQRAETRNFFGITAGKRARDDLSFIEGSQFGGFEFQMIGIGRERRRADGLGPVLRWADARAHE
jgi:hypothetical protein